MSDESCINFRATVYNESHTEIDIDGLVSFSIENLGAVTATVNNVVPFVTDQSRPYGEKVRGLYKGKINLDFADRTGDCRLLVQEYRVIK